MITILHGDDLVASRNKLKELVDSRSSWEIIRFEGAKLTTEEYLQAAESKSIISPEKLIIIENFLSLKKSLEKTNKENILLKNLPDVELIIWEAKELDKTTLNKITDARVFNYPLPKLLWRFLDSIGIIATTDLVSMFHEIIKSQDVNFIFAMMVRQWHNLLLCGSAQKETAVGLTSWQLAKFKRQAKAFTSSSLLNSYRQLVAIDYKIKSGSTPLKLKEWLDIFLINL